LDEAGILAADLTADHIADLVDELLGKRWSRRMGGFIESDDVIPLQVVEQQEPVEATCSCGSGIPVHKVVIEGRQVTFIALPLIFEQFRQAGKQPGSGIARELLDEVRIYNPIPAGTEEAYTETLVREYAAYCAEKEPAQ
jgi:hypothetical protein